MEVIAEVAREVRPRIVVVENVPAFLSRLVIDPETRDEISAAALLIRLLQNNYRVFPFLADLADYGIPPGSSGRAWQNSMCERCGEVDVGSEDAVCPVYAVPLLRPVVQEADGSYRLVKGFRNSSYTRMAPDAPAATVTTASGHVGSDLTIHPFENRLLSPFECAYLQTFPDDFDWGVSLERWGTTFVRTIIGEAVPPKFTEMHGRVLVDMLAGRISELAQRTDTRVLKAEKRLKSRQRKRLKATA